MSGPLPSFCAPLAVPASWAYGVAVGARNARFDRGDGVSAVGIPVISVGNITAGGAGKTPMVAWVAERLIAHGRRPVIAMRGYKARPGEPGDEQQEHALRLPGVPVVADPDRVGALRAFLAGGGGADCAVLDDGFQHRRIRRDLDLVLIDASRDTMRDRLLPAGWLREPVESLRRADAVVVTRAEAVDPALSARIERAHGRPPAAWSRHAWSGLDRVDGEGETLDVSWLAGKRVLTLLGVGHPASIVAQLEQAGAEVAARLPARDHEHYDRPKMTLARGLCEAVDALVMTAKDWVKARRLIDAGSWPVPIVVPRLRIDVFEGGPGLERMILGCLERRAYDGG